MKNKFLKGMLIPGMAALFLIACNKEENAFDTDTDSAADNAIAEAYFDQVQEIVDEESAGSAQLNQRNSGNSVVTSASGCADSIKIVSTNGGYPKTLTVYFSNAICNNRIVNGRIVTVFTGPFRTTGSSRITHLENFSVDGNVVQGVRTVMNMGNNTSGNPYYTVSIDDASIITTNGTISWEANRVWEWSNGSSTPLNIFDDEYKVTGSSNGTNRKGGEFTSTITKALLVKVGCKYITEGTINFVRANGKTLSLDYGNGLCDDDAVVTINGKTYPIKLK